MSLFDELEIMTDSMSPKFMVDIQTKLERAIAYPSAMTIMKLKSEINEFIWAVKITGNDKLEGSLNDLLEILDGPGDKRENLSKLLEKFKELNENIPILEPAIDEDEDIYKDLDKFINEENIEKFLMIPGIGRERAMALLEEGFDSIEELSAAPLARITMVTGISLSLAKDIADFLNPNRLLGMEILPMTLSPSRSSEEISFSGKPFIDKDSESDMMVETSEDDPELLKIYLVRLREFLNEAVLILDTLSTSSTPKVIISNLEDSSTSLLNVTRYMGFDLIESELTNIAKISNEILSGEIELSETAVFAIKQAQAGLEYGLEKLNALLRATAEHDDINEEITQEDAHAVHKHINEIHHLYKNLGDILERALESGAIDEKELQRLNKNTELFVEMTGSLKKNSDNKQEN